MHHPRKPLSQLSDEELEEALIQVSENVIFSQANIVDEIRYRARRRNSNRRTVIALVALYLQSIAVIGTLMALLFGFVA